MSKEDDAFGVAFRRQLDAMYREGYQDGYEAGYATALRAYAAAGEGSA